MANKVKEKRMANARAKAEAADQAAERAQKDSDLARLKAKEYAPEFHQPGTDIMRKQLENNEMEYDFSHVTGLANHQPFRSKSLNSPHSQPNFEGQDPSGLSAISALHGEPGGHRPEEYSNHQLLNIMPGGPGGGGVQNQALHVNQHSRSPSLKVRRYSFLAGSRRGRGFSEIFNSTILTDHFDQYAADSGIGGDSLGTLANNPITGNHSNNPHSYSNHNPRQRMPATTNPSPDSGVSDTMEEETSKIRSLQRRRTMPCIVDDSSATKVGMELANAKQKLAELETARSNDNLTSKLTDTFIIENGIRKRIQAEVHSKPNKENRQLPKEYKIVPASDKQGGGGLDKRGSLPDLKNVSTFKPMSRREAYQLGNARREEIRRLQELAERRRQGDMSVILGDVRDWCQERQLLVLVIALNLSLATMFFNLLS